jgi:hypothetical protein
MNNEIEHKKAIQTPKKCNTKINGDKATGPNGFSMASFQV